MTGTAFTIVGARGLVGRALHDDLLKSGASVTAHDRLDYRMLEAQVSPVGHVIYAGGVTADFRTRPHDTMHAHVATPTDLLRSDRFDSFLYLSSTRLYRRASTTEETADFTVDPNDADATYDLSKLAGESICLADSRPRVRVVRLSNVYDKADRSDTFLPSLIRDALGSGGIELRSHSNSAKDFVALPEVVRLLPEIATMGRQRIYNLAAGHNTRFGSILEELSRLTGCNYTIAPECLKQDPVVDLEIDVRHITEEFSGARSNLLEDLAGLVEART